MEFLINWFEKIEEKSWKKIERIIDLNLYKFVIYTEKNLKKIVVYL